MCSFSASVLVVGAGPTGLLLASELQRRGVRCHLIDARPEPLHWDRATVVHLRSLEIFESLGLAERFLEAGCRHRTIKIHSGGKVLGTMDLSNCGSIYGFNLGVSACWNTTLTIALPLKCICVRRASHRPNTWTDAAVTSRPCRLTSVVFFP